jgi:hypothetical protein
MRKQAISCSGTKPSGNVSRGVAAPAFLTLPTLSRFIPLNIKSNAGDDCALQILSLFSNCIDIAKPSGKLSTIFNPVETAGEMLCDCISGWIDQAGYKHLGQLDLHVTVYNPNCAEIHFENLYYGQDGKLWPLLYIEMGGDRDREYNVSYLRDNQKIGAAILDLFDKSPVYIMSPSRLLDAVSWMYWGGNCDETERIEELKNEQDAETVEEDIASCIPIVRNDFDVAFADWTMKEPAKPNHLPDEAQRLEKANAKYESLVKKYKFYPEHCESSLLPGITLTGLADEPIQAQGIFTKFWDDTIEEAYNNGGDTHLSPFAMFINPQGGYEAAKQLLEILRAYLDCMDAAVGLLLWLESQIKQEIKVTS